MRKTHKFTCINCPLSCSLELVEEDGEILEVRGNDCEIGRRYAEEEFRDPRRMVTTTVRVRNGILPLLPVVSTGPIPKALVKEAVRILAGVTVEAPVEDGQLIHADILGTGADIVASRRLDRAYSTGNA
ncbi:MAG: DUF1667 domain-containing protein [Actinobacteria bacterium]|nr:DUF1667 domain-containing protein [Actinomycetota bacterium]